MRKTVGVLALQGDFAAHARVLQKLECEVREVRKPEHLTDLHALCIPGGESTTMSLLLDQTQLRAPLRSALAPAEQGGAALPCLATCAGMILLAEHLTGDTGSRQVEPLGLLDATVDRNGYGRQVDSFEAPLDLDWAALGQPRENPEFAGIFIRAPRIVAVGPRAIAVGHCGAEAVLLRQGHLLAACFHPELSGDARLHAALLDIADTDDR